MSKDMDFCNLLEIYLTKGKQLLDTADKTGLDAVETASKKVFPKVTEAMGEFIGNKLLKKL